MAIAISMVKAATISMAIAIPMFSMSHYQWQYQYQCFSCHNINANSNSNSFSNTNINGNTNCNSSDHQCQWQQQWQCFFHTNINGNSNAYVLIMPILLAIPMTVSILYIFCQWLHACMFRNYIPDRPWGAGTLGGELEILSQKEETFVTGHNLFHGFSTAMISSRAI